MAKITLNFSVVLVILMVEPKKANKIASPAKAESSYQNKLVELVGSSESVKRTNLRFSSNKPRLVDDSTSKSISYVEYLYFTLASGNSFQSCVGNPTGITYRACNYCQAYADTSSSSFQGCSQNGSTITLTFQSFLDTSCKKPSSPLTVTSKVTTNSCTAITDSGNYLQANAIISEVPSLKSYGSIQYMNSFCSSPPESITSMSGCQSVMKGLPVVVDQNVKSLKYIGCSTGKGVLAEMFSDNYCNTTTGETITIPSNEECRVGHADYCTF